MAWYSALIFVKAKDKEEALQWAQYNADSLVERDLCDWSKTDSNWLNYTLRLKDGSTTNVCRLSEFQEFVDSELNDLLFLIDDATQWVEDFSSNMTVSVKKEILQDWIEKAKDDPFLVTIAVHHCPIWQVIPSEEE